MLCELDQTSILSATNTIIITSDNSNFASFNLGSSPKMVILGLCPSYTYLLYNLMYLPKAVIMPNMTQKIPPTTGSGIMMKAAPNLLMTP